MNKKYLIKYSFDLTKSLNFKTTFKTVQTTGVQPGSLLPNLFSLHQTLPKMHEGTRVQPVTKNKHYSHFEKTLAF